MAGTAAAIPVPAAVSAAAAAAAAAKYPAVTKIVVLHVQNAQAEGVLSMARVVLAEYIVLPLSRCLLDGIKAIRYPSVFLDLPQGVTVIPTCLLFRTTTERH